MRAWEFILEHANKLSLFEMAYEQRDAKKLVTEASPRIFEHLAKIYCLNVPASTTRYWIKEINNKWLTKINEIRLKPKNKIVSYSLLSKWMLEDSAPHYDIVHLRNVIKTLRYDDYKVKDSINEEAVLSAILSIMNSLCEDITDGKFEHLSDYIKLEVGNE
jgi:hypothetical protein